MDNTPKKPVLTIVPANGALDHVTEKVENEEIAELLLTINDLHKDGRLNTLMMIAILDDGVLATGVAGVESVFRTVGALEIGSQYLKDQLMEEVMYD